MNHVQLLGPEANSGFFLDPFLGDHFIDSFIQQMFLSIFPVPGPGRHMWTEGGEGGWRG